MAGAGSVASADGRWDALWTGVHLACMTDAAYGAIEDGALAVRDGRIAWLGRRRDLPAGVASATEHDGGGRWLTPALIDCHTHLVFGGDRADEFERRLGGESYESIARAGGGILSTVRATRAASEDELVASAARRAAALVAEGVGTIEVKSGYGLDVESELKMLRAARRVAERVSVRVSTTCLALHALPPESRDDRAAYLRLVVDELLPRVAGERLADAVDVYCERIAFSRDECAAVLSRARALGLATRVHADQLSDGGGAALAAEFAARSAEHLEYASEAGVAAMARACTVAVLLPGAYVLLRETQPPPVEALRRRGVPIAVATDCNPGTSPVTSLLAMLPLAAAAFRLTPAECLAGVTRHAARALGLDGELGTLEVGKRAEAVLWDVGHPRELAYWLGRNPLVARLRG